MNNLTITLKPGQHIYFTSDLHFGHRNILNFCNRPFEDTKTMEIGLINNWNSVVQPDDIVINLGDMFWFNDSKPIAKILSQLNGEHYIVPGNHDDFKAYHRVSNPKVHLLDAVIQLWVHVEDWEERKLPKKSFEIHLCHYPLMTWPHRERGAIQLFGHIHSRPGITEGFDQDLPLWNTQLDVGADANNYTPISLECILSKLGYCFNIREYCKNKKLCDDIGGETMCEVMKTL